jgi:sortase A
VRRVAFVFLAGGLLALGYAAYVVSDAKVYQVREQRRLEQTPLEATPLERTRPVKAASPRVVVGSAIGEIQIPRLRLTAIVTQGDSEAILRRSVGHLADTALPGETGNVVLAGHRDTLFRPLKDVNVGDFITVKTRAGHFEYVVESTTVVRPDDVEVLEATGGRTLTLITCFPFSYLGSAPNRFIVRARETEVDVR